jgi:hypothetical protein
MSKDTILGNMQNLFVSENSLQLYVWVDPNDFVANWNLNVVGSFTSTPDASDGDNLMFIPNPKFNNFVSPFQANLLWSYAAEYNLELHRRKYYPKYPSRLKATFLFETKEEASKYRERNREHVAGRELRTVSSIGRYCFSRHDCSWVDFLRLRGSLDDTSISAVCDCYWRGETVEQNKLLHRDQSWSECPIFEVLFMGRVDLVRSETDGSMRSFDSSTS